ncbi:uncharacterized protein LOC127073287 [Lathyrus oleraceus]|uniref:Vitellogenin-like protein n=1 Tax=Pisum sativum TaxID=3888 RepID=A0A9D4X8P7_PEA|nr:uncharacterized protein LOC127073287 [Pisum sativum]KAI5415737.1 hypothetical protein KIW84_040956 [Pisum sativum]
MIHIHMEAIKLGVGNGKVNIAAEDDSIDGMQCIDHPYRNNPGGICAFCLQEKLGKLVSSSFPLPIHASSSSSSSPSFRSNVAPSSSSTSTTRHCASSSSSAINTVSTTTAVASSSSLSLSVCPIKNENNGKPFHHEYYSRKTRIPFLLAKKKKKKNTVSGSGSGSATSNNIILKRSKSTATPRRGSSNSLVDADDEYFSPRKRNGFWSFLYLSSKSSAKNLNSKSFRDGNNTATTTAAKLKEKCCSGSSLGRKNDIVIVEEEEENSPNRNSNNNNNNTGSSIERKVSRSRSVGCGSRSFSGDFFERISTGFGDCTLRRVESQREGKSKVVSSSSTGIASVNANGDHHHHHCMKERVLRRCGGIFSGFMMTSSSSSNSSNSSYWVSSNSADETVNGGKQGSVSISQNNNRGGRSWGWAFASPMRAFSSKSSSKENHHNKRDIIRDANDKINATPNLSAMPSLLAARG